MTITWDDFGRDPTPEGETLSEREQDKAFSRTTLFVEYNLSLIPAAIQTISVHSTPDYWYVYLAVGANISIYRGTAVAGVYVPLLTGASAKLPYRTRTLTIVNSGGNSVTVYAAAARGEEIVINGV